MYFVLKINHFSLLSTLKSIYFSVLYSLQDHLFFFFFLASLFSNITSPEYYLVSYLFLSVNMIVLLIICQ